MNETSNETTSKMCIALLLELVGGTISRSMSSSFSSLRVLSLRILGVELFNEDFEAVRDTLVYTPSEVRLYLLRVVYFRLHRWKGPGGFLPFILPGLGVM